MFRNFYFIFFKLIVCTIFITIEMLLETTNVAPVSESSEMALQQPSLIARTGL